MANKSLIITGPFVTEYSFAKMNRGLAIAMAKSASGFDIKIRANSEEIDRMPTSADFKKFPALKDIFDTGTDKADVIIYNNFPKNPGGDYGLKNLNATTKLAYLSWEESIFPEKWVEEINNNLHGILVISEHVASVFRKCGVRIPILVVNPGLNIHGIKPEKFALTTDKEFKFLHISSAHPRKGVDVMLKAYFKEFSAKDDVCLVLKLFPNVASVAEEVLQKLKRDDAPEVLLIKKSDLLEGEIVSITSQCQAGVYPSRAEGFGFPVAEAMLLGLPVITTGYSGQLDFCNAENSLLLDYKMTDAIEAQNPYPGAKWAEPDQAQLQQHMRYLYENSESEQVKTMIKKGKQAVEPITWEAAAESTLRFVKFAEKISELKNKKLAVISTLNTKCGIADYSCRLYPLMQDSFADFKVLANKDAGDRVSPDGPEVIRTWEYGEEDFAATLKEIDKLKPNVVHVQYNPPFYGLDSLGKLLTGLESRGIKSYLTLHSVQVGYADFKRFLPQLAKAARIFLHSHADLDYLLNIGYKNAEYFEYPATIFTDEDRFHLRDKLNVSASPVLATHGLIHNGKGILESIEAVSILKKDFPDLLLLCINAINPNNSTSSATFQQMKELVRKHNLQDNVLFFTEFLELPEVSKLLHLADIVLLPYADLKESASGAVRTSVAARRPVVITESHIFADLPIGSRIKNNNPQLVAGMVKKLLTDKSLYKEELSKINKYLNQNSLEKRSREFLEIVALDLN